MFLVNESSLPSQKKTAMVFIVSQHTKFGSQKKKDTSITYLHSFLLIYSLIIVGFITQFVLVKPFGTPKFYKNRNQGLLIFIPFLLGIFYSTSIKHPLKKWSLKYVMSSPTKSHGFCGGVANMNRHRDEQELLFLLFLGLVIPTKNDV